MDPGDADNEHLAAAILVVRAPAEPKNENLTRNA